MKNYLIDNYQKLSKAEGFIYGFVLDKTLYYTTANKDSLKELATLSASSTKRGGGLALRFRPTRRQKLILSRKAVKIEGGFEALQGVKNKGIAFEGMMHKLLNKADYKKESNPFYKEPDLIFDGKGYEIKFEGGTYANEKIIANALKEATI